MAVEKTKTNQRKTCKEQNPDYFERERDGPSEKTHLGWDRDAMAML